MRIGVIASLKRGLEHFVYRELGVFTEQGHHIDLFPTRFRPGLYNPQETWSLHRWNLWGVMAAQPLSLARRPLRYMRLLWEAFGRRSLIDFLLAWYFARAIRKVDVIYATFGDHKLFIGYFCKKITGKPLVVTIHAYELYDNPNPRLFVRALASCDRIITVTDYNKELLIDGFGCDPNKVEVVRISVDVSDYRPARKFVVLIVAFFNDRKGHGVLFEALGRLPQDDIEIWVVGGEGAEAPVDVEALAVSYGVTDRVAFFGKLSGNALKAVYRACDVFCLPCRTDGQGVAEGFPTVLAEAMAFGKPIITTNHVEIPRILDEVLVEENDAAGLAQAILQLYHSAPRRQALGAKNRKLAERLFSTRNAERAADLLEKVVRSAGESPNLPRYLAKKAGGATQDEVESWR